MAFFIPFQFLLFDYCGLDGPVRFDRIRFTLSRAVLLLLLLFLLLLLLLLLLPLSLAASGSVSPLVCQAIQTEEIRRHPPFLHQ